MGNPFKKPKAPKLPPVPKGPTDAEIAAAAEEDKQSRRYQRGRGATMLSGEAASLAGGTLGDDVSGMATKKLLGG